MTYVDEKSAQIEREIEQDRRRIEDKIGAIQDKLSPGQLVDEALAYRTQARNQEQPGHH